VSGGDRRRLVVLEVLDRRGNRETVFGAIDEYAITLL